MDEEQGSERPRINSGFEVRSTVCFLGAALILLAAMLIPRAGMGSVFAVSLLVPAVCLAALGVAVSVRQPQPQRATNRKAWLIAVLVACVLVHLAAGFAVVHRWNGEGIDVYLFQRDAAAALLHGTDPYTITIPDIYGPVVIYYSKGVVANGRVQIGSPYPPFSLVSVVPAYLLGDIRYTYVAAVVLTALLLVAMQFDAVAVGLACLLLLNPITFVVEAHSWTEPFVLLTATWTLFAAFRRSRWLPVALGCFLASKQYSVLALPLVAFLTVDNSWRATRRLLLQSIGVTAVLTVPLAAWNFRAFWADVVRFQLAQPFRPNALSLAILFPVPLAAVLLVTLIAAAWSFRKARPHPAMFAGGFGFVLLVFFCCNKQAFNNYYFLVVGLLLVAGSCIRIPFSRPGKRPADGAA